MNPEVGQDCTIKIGTDYYGDFVVYHIAKNNITVKSKNNDTYGYFSKRKDGIYWEVKCRIGKGKELLIGINKTYGDPNF